MYKLSMFQKFDFASWQKDKSFMIQGVKYNAKKGCVSLDVVITEDCLTVSRNGEYQFDYEK